MRTALAVATVISVVSASLAVQIYKVSAFGPAQLHMKAGFIAYYSDAFLRHHFQ
jgi:hypothetical protein